MNDFAPKVQTLHPDEHLLCHAGSVGVKFRFNALDTSIVSMIEQFGIRLYYGYPTPETFLQKFFLHRKNYLIQQLNHFDTSVNIDIGLNEFSNPALYLYMLRVAQSQEWDYPALANRSFAEEFMGTTGGTRAFATGLTKPMPWNHFPILLADHDNFDPTLLLQNPIHIKNDRMLNECLGGEYRSDIWEPTIRLSVDIKNVNNSINCKLTHLDDNAYYNLSVARGVELLENFKQWKIKYPNRPKLKIYTNYPENIRDICGIWDWHIVDTFDNFVSDTAQLQLEDRLEVLPRFYHNHNRYHGNIPEVDHVLWIQQPRVIDIGDLLPWMTAQSNSFVSSDQAFALYRTDDNYNITTVDVSYHL